MRETFWKAAAWKTKKEMDLREMVLKTGSKWKSLKIVSSSVLQC